MATETITVLCNVNEENDCCCHAACVHFHDMRISMGELRDAFLPRSRK